MKALALLLVIALLAGCTGTPTKPATTPSVSPTRASPSTPTPTPAAITPSTSNLSEGFDASRTLPSGWTKDSGNWSVEANASAPSAPNVLRGEGGGGRSTLKSSSGYGDFDASAKFLMMSGDEGAGLSFRYQPNGDYRIIRYSVREAGWHYFILEGGAADKKNEATVAQNGSQPAFGQWVTLRILAEGRHVQAWDGTTLVIDFNDPGAPAVGSVGPFLRGSAVALFDDLRVQPR